MLLSLVHNVHMDIEWFKSRKKEVGVTDQMLADAIGRERSVANKIVGGKIPFDGRHAAAFGELLKVSPEEILRHAGVLKASESDLSSNAEVIPLEGASLEETRDDLPVYGTALGAPRKIEGEAIEQTTLNRGDTIEYAQRPVMLNRRIDAYALYVQGVSMHPALPDGEMVAVIPNAPLDVGDNVVVYLRPDNPDDDDGLTARAVLVKELVRLTVGFVELRQYEPRKDFRIEMREVIRIDRVLTRKEMLR